MNLQDAIHTIFADFPQACGIGRCGVAQGQTTTSGGDVTVIGNRCTACIQQAHGRLNKINFLRDLRVAQVGVGYADSRNWIATTRIRCAVQIHNGIGHTHRRRVIGRFQLNLNFNIAIGKQCATRALGVARTIVGIGVPIADPVGQAHTCGWVVVQIPIGNGLQYRIGLTAGDIIAEGNFQLATVIAH